MSLKYNLPIFKSALYILIISLFIIPYFSPESISQEQTKELEYSFTEVREGDHCTVSGHELYQDDIALIVQGRRVPLKKEALDIFLSSPEKYFSKLQAKSALFTEDMNDNKNLSYGWFLFGVYVLIGLIFAALCSHIAIAKGLKPVPWFFAGLLLCVIAYFILVMKKSESRENIPDGLRKVPLTYDPSSCPICKNLNHPSAKNCSSCGAELKSSRISETEILGLKN